MASVAYWFRCFSREYPRRQLKLRPEQQQQQATLLNAKEIHNTCTFTLCTFSKSYSRQAVWGCYILSQLCINSPCMLIFKKVLRMIHISPFYDYVKKGYGLVCRNKTRKSKNCWRASCLQIWNVSITTIAYQFYN